MTRKSSGSSQSPKFPFLNPSPGGVFISLRVQPRASKNRVAGVQGGSLKIALTSPPVEGEANSALIEFLSELLNIRKSSLSIASGARSREKRVKAEGVTLEELERAFSGIIGNTSKD